MLYKLLKVSTYYYNITMLLKHFRPQRPPPPHRASGNLFILFAGFNRARRGQLERFWQVVVVVTPASVGRQDNVAIANRGLLAKWVSKPPDERSTCVKTGEYKAVGNGIEV